MKAVRTTRPVNSSTLENLKTFVIKYSRVTNTNDIFLLKQVLFDYHYRLSDYSYENSRKIEDMKLRMLEKKNKYNSRRYLTYLKNTCKKDKL